MYKLLKQYKPRHTVASAFNYPQKLRRFEESYHPKIMDIVKQEKLTAQRMGNCSAKRFPQTSTMLSFLFTSPQTDCYRIIDMAETADFNWFVDDLIDEKSLLNQELSRDEMIDVIRYFAKIWDKYPCSFSDDRPEMNQFLDRLDISDNLRDKIEKCCRASYSAAHTVSTTAPPQFFQRFSFEFQTHLQSLIDATDKWPSPQEYITRKRIKCGMIHQSMQIEYVSQNYLFDHRSTALNEALPSLEKMRIASMDIGGLSNDLFSLPKEAKAEPHGFPRDNLICVMLQRAENQTVNGLSAAIDDTIDIVNRATDQFAEAHKRCLNEMETREASLIDAGYTMNEIEEYLELLERFTYGCFEWQLVCGRYISDIHLFRDLKPKIDSPSSSQTEDHDLSNGVVSQDPSTVDTQLVLVIPPSYSVVHAV